MSKLLLAVFSLKTFGAERYFTNCHCLERTWPHRCSMRISPSPLHCISARHIACVCDHLTMHAGRHETEHIFAINRLVPRPIRELAFIWTATIHWLFRWVPLNEGYVSSCCSWRMLHFTKKGLCFSSAATHNPRVKQNKSKSAGWILCGSALFLPHPGAHLKLWPPGYSDPVTLYPEAYSEANTPNWGESIDRVIFSFFHWILLELNMPRDLSFCLFVTRRLQRRLLCLLSLAAWKNLFLLAAFKWVCVPCHCIAPRGVCFVRVVSLVQMRPRSHHPTHSDNKECLVGSASYALTSLWTKQWS